MTLSHLRCWSGANGMEVKVENFVEHLLIRLVGGCLEEIPVTAPHGMHEEHGTEHAGGHFGIYVAKFAILDAALENSRHEPTPPFHDLGRVESYEVGKAAEFRVDETEERGELRRPQEAPVAAHELRERLPG